MYLKTKSYGEGKPILFGSNARRTPFSVALKADDILPDANGKKYVPEGCFIADIDGNIRVLPRTLTASNILTTSPDFTLNAPCMSFKVGDVLMVGFQVSLVLSGTPVAGDIITITTSNSRYSITVGATPTLASVKTQLQGLTIPNCNFVGSPDVPSDNRLWIRSFSSQTITVDVKAVNSSSTLAAFINSTDTGYFGHNPAPIGTIQSIGNADAQGRRVVTLSGNANSGWGNVGRVVFVAHDKLLGVLADPLDFTDTPVIHVAPVFHADGVYQSNLPYIDAQIKRELPGLNINPKFYGHAL